MAVKFRNLQISKILKRLSIKYVRSDFVILDTLFTLVHAHMRLAYTPCPKYELMDIIFESRYDKYYILWITFNKRTTNNVTK